MQEGDRVTAPHPLDAVGGLRLEATYVASGAMAGPVTTDGFQVTTIMHRVRYDDGTEMDWPDGTVLPIEQKS